MSEQKVVRKVFSLGDSTDSNNFEVVIPEVVNHCQCVILKICAIKCAAHTQGAWSFMVTAFVLCC